MIYSKTALGQEALHNRSITLTPKQRAVFIMVDGKKTAEELLKAAAGLGVTAADLQHLLSAGVVQAEADVTEPSALPNAHSPYLTPPAPANAPATIANSANQNPQACYARAYPIATRLTAALGLRGFRLNLSVEGATDLEKLKALFPKIKEAIGADKAQELYEALEGKF